MDRQRRRTGRLWREVATAGALLVLLTATAPPLAHGAPHQKFFWDFRECFDLTVHTGGTEYVPGERYGLPGGCFLHFGDADRSWLETTFVLNGAPAEAGQLGAWRLTVYHLAPAPDDQTRGYAPVRVLLNGQEVWQGSPADRGRFGPGESWAATEVDVSGALSAGPNTLRWDLLPSATAPYWLKVIDIAWYPD